MSRLRRAGAAAWCALALASCSLGRAPEYAFSDAWEHASAHIDSAIAAGRFDEAEHALEASTSCVRPGLAAAWQQRERERLLAELPRWRARPEAARDSLVTMWTALAAAGRAEASDSLVAAERWARLACELGASTLGATHPRTALAQMELGRVAFMLSRTHEVDSLTVAAEASLRAAFGEEHPAVADARELLGRTLKNFSGRTARSEALGRYRQALRTRVALYGPSSTAVAESYQDIGNLERLCVRPHAALEALGVALAIRRRALGSEHPDVASTLSAMGVLRASIGDWAGAESLFSVALEAGGPLSTRSFRLGMLGQVRLKQGRAAAAEPPLREAIALAESAWVLTPRDEGSTVFSGLSTYSDLAMALAAQGKSEEAFEVLERGTSRTLSEHAPPGSGSARGQPLLERLQHVLSPDAAMVSWVHDRLASPRGEMVWACVVRSTGPPRWIRLESTMSRLPGGGARSASLWYELRATARWPMRLDAGDADLRLESAVSSAWFTPLEASLDGVHHVIVFSPDLVGGCPLGALCDAQGRSLLERYAISYAPSAAFYAMERERRRDLTPAAAALVVGDPAYNGADAESWPTLRGSREEIATVRAALPRVRVLDGADANARSLRALARSGELSRFRVLHVATHTQVDPRRIMEASLVLAPDHAGEGESMLSAREIADTWRLDADLVCLTGCQTALGFRAASQGLLGLQQAFFRAGARSVLVSLWPVDDAATALLMREFYRRLPTASGPGARAEALREAQRAVRDWESPGGAHPYAHPAYWAGFTLVGDAG